MDEVLRQKDFYVFLKSGTLMTVLPTNSHDQETAFNVANFLVLQEGRLPSKVVFKLRNSWSSKFKDGLYLIGEFLSVEHVKYEDLIMIMAHDKRNL